MMRRRWLRRLTPAALALLAAASAPRGLVLVHHHDGDERAHVHVFDGAEPDHHHSRAHAPLRRGATGVETSDATAPDHVHWRHPFQRASVPAAPQLARADRADVIALHAPRLAPVVRLLPSPARAPPAAI